MLDTLMGNLCPVFHLCFSIHVLQAPKSQIQWYFKYGDQTATFLNQPNQQTNGVQASSAPITDGHPHVDLHTKNKGAGGRRESKDNKRAMVITQATNKPKISTFI